MWLIDWILIFACFVCPFSATYEEVIACSLPKYLIIAHYLQKPTIQPCLELDAFFLRLFRHCFFCDYGNGKKVEQVKILYHCWKFSIKLWIKSCCNLKIYALHISGSCQNWKVSYQLIKTWETQIEILLLLWYFLPWSGRRQKHEMWWKWRFCVQGSKFCYFLLFLLSLVVVCFDIGLYENRSVNDQNDI